MTCSDFIERIGKIGKVNDRQLTTIFWASPKQEWRVHVHLLAHGILPRILLAMGRGSSVEEAALSAWEHIPVNCARRGLVIPTDVEQSNDQP